MLVDPVTMPLEYAKAHAVCPSCGAERYAKRPKSPKTEDGKYLEDLGEVECLACEWKGVGHDLVPAGSVDIIGGTRRSAYQVYRLIERAQGKIAAEIRVMLGESPMPSTAFSQASAGRRVRALIDCAANNTSDEDRHSAWCQMHMEAGWVYGEVFDEKAKTHPNLLAWCMLSPAVQAKARIFAHMAELANEIVKLFR